MNIFKKHIGIFLGYDVLVLFEGEGIGRFIFRLIEGLLDNSQDLKVTIVTKGVNYPNLTESLEKQLLHYPNKLSIQIFDDVEWLNRNVSADVWIVPYIGLKSALQLEKPIIVCLHDLVYIHFNELYKDNEDFNKSFTSLANEMVIKAKKVVFNSNYIRNNEGLKFLKLPMEKTKVIRLAAPLEEYINTNLLKEDVFRNKYKLYDDYIVYPSIMRLHKNHDRLVKAFLNFKKKKQGEASNCSLVLTDRYKDYVVQNKIKEYINNCEDKRIGDSIILLGRLPWEDIPSLYKYAKGTIVPTLFEGSCPFQILESLIMDTPVAMSKIDVIEEVIPDLRSFITFDPYSLEEIEEAINQLCKAKRKDLKKQKKAVQQTLKRSWTDVAMEYYDLITEIIS